MPLSNTDARHVITHYKQKGERVDEVLHSVVLNHVSRLEHENKRLREALKQILEDEAPNCDGYETFIHATARKALEGDSIANPSTD